MDGNELKSMLYSFISCMHQVKKKIIIPVIEQNKHNLQGLHFHILSILSKQGEMTYGELGSQLYLSKPHLTLVINELVEKDLLKRNNSKEDRRKIFLIMTSKGKKIFKEHKKQIQKKFSDHIKILTENDLDKLSKSLRNLEEILTKL